MIYIRARCIGKYGYLIGTIKTPKEEDVSACACNLGLRKHVIDFLAILNIMEHDVNQTFLFHTTTINLPVPVPLTFRIADGSLANPARTGSVSFFFSHAKFSLICSTSFA
ncbi:hypothetical protein TorRG33x02_039310 [Trema orientale]|uniref:Uncharacterized protein n=1 Tax=Trema orientale TaxID=63057 RepID=A0A2P5FQR4_TREOI|nr:hypothetical protein TorRG33x02_039310 [Trema orientale]